MSTVYLVDYENVHEHGIYGMRMLPVEDTVFIMYTENADKVSLDCFDNVKAYYRVIRVPAGNQSLDMHLSTFLGYLIGSEEDAETKYVVISNDTDYQGIINFWMTRYSTPDKVTRQRYIGDTGVCSDPILQPEVPEYCKPVPRANRRDVIRQCIRQVFVREGEKDEWGCLRIQLSLLCARLNALPAYQQEKKICGKKPQQFLTEDFPDLLRVDYVNRTTYAYAVKPLVEMIEALQETSESATAEESKTPIADNDEETTTESNEAFTAEMIEQPEELQPLPAESVDDDIDDEADVFNLDDAVLALPEIPEEEPKPDESAIDETPSAASQQYTDTEKTLLDGGIDSVVAAVIAPIVANLELVDSPKVYLYNNIRQHFGTKQGTHYYHQVKALLNL